MKVIQVIDSLNVGGAQKLMVVFAREMHAKGHMVRIISLARRDETSPVVRDLEELGVEIISLPLRSLFDLNGQKRLRAEIKAGRTDIVHTQLNYANIHGTLAAKLVGKRAVSSLHNASVHLYGYKPYRIWLETMALRCCSSRIIACGFTVANVQQHRFRRKHLDVIPNPVPPQPTVSAAQIKAVRRELGIKSDEIVVISVGRLIPEKGYSDLIQAIGVINHTAKMPVRLLIVGRGYLMPRLEEEVRQAGQQDSVLLLGERDDVPKLLAASDIYASASHYEGQSLAVLEAMAGGLPVVATDVGDNRRVISDECGVVLPSGQVDQLTVAISRLAASPQERRRLGKNASAYVREVYSPAVWVERLLDIYAEVLSD